MVFRMTGMFTYNRLQQRSVFYLETYSLSPKILRSLITWGKLKHFLVISKRHTACYTHHQGHVPRCIQFPAALQRV